MVFRKRRAKQMPTDKINLTPKITQTGPFKGRKPLLEVQINGIKIYTKKNSMVVHDDFRSPRCPVCGKYKHQWPAQNANSVAFEKTTKARVAALLPDDYAMPDKPVTLCWDAVLSYRPRRIDISNVIAALDDAFAGTAFADDDWSRVKSHRGSRIGYDKDNPHIVLRMYAYDPKQD